MNFQLFTRHVGKWIVVASLMGFGFAMAQQEPSLNQVYATAQAGKLDEAQVMIQQVLVSHPKSGKAHFVRAELYSRQGKMDLARESLASAEKYSPGLAFAKPEAVQALRAQLSARAPANVAASPPARYDAPAANSAPAPAASSSWGLPLLLAGGVIVAGYFIFRRKAQVPMAQQPSYANQGGLSGAQGFGMGGGAMQPGNPQQPGYPQQGYPQQGYPQQAGSGLGGRIMGGVATGLAVGAGVMAAQAIGKSLMGDHNENSAQSNKLGNSDYQPTASNQDMGGNNFGLNDSSSWDDGGSADAGGAGGDWDT